MARATQPSRPVRRYSAAEAAKLAGFSPRRMQRWIRQGWIRPAVRRGRIAYFDYEQLVGLRRLGRLLAAGTSAGRMSLSLRQFRAWLPPGSDLLRMLAPLSLGTRPLVRTPTGRLAEAHGQLLIEFDEAGSPLSLPLPSQRDDLAQRAQQCDAAGEWAEAAGLYRELLDRASGDANLWFNYAGTLYALERVAEAAAALEQCLRRDPLDEQAWNNLGAMLLDLGRPDEAERALRRALALVPGYADAHFNLAEALLAKGSAAAASRHFRIAGRAAK
ncbi:MAG: tetratricopeptide repeat protein [Pirellulaceae bacterium]